MRSFPQRTQQEQRRYRGFGCDLSGRGQSEKQWNSYSSGGGGWGYGRWGGWGGYGGMSTTTTTTETIMLAPRR